MKKLLLPFAVFAAFTAPAIAAPAWDYVEAGYVKTDIDNLRNVDVDGFEVSGKKRISSNYFVEGKVFDLSGFLVIINFSYGDILPSGSIIRIFPLKIFIVIILIM